MGISKSLVCWTISSIDIWQPTVLQSYWSLWVVNHDPSKHRNQFLSELNNGLDVPSQLAPAQDLRTRLLGSWEEEEGGDQVPWAGGDARAARVRTILDSEQVQRPLPSGTHSPRSSLRWPRSERCFCGRSRTTRTTWTTRQRALQNHWSPAPQPQPVPSRNLLQQKRRGETTN